MVRGPGGLLALDLVIPLDGDGCGHAAESQTRSDNQLNHVFLHFAWSNLESPGDGARGYSPPLRWKRVHSPAPMPTSTGWMSGSMASAVFITTVRWT